MSSQVSRDIARLRRIEHDESERFYAELMGAPGTTSDADEAERFYAELVGRPSARRSPSRWFEDESSTTPAAGACIRPDRELRFASGVTAPAVLSFPHTAICKILVLKRAGSLAGIGIVDEYGRPVEQPPDRPSDDPSGSAVAIDPSLTGLVQGEGTGFYVDHNRIVTAAHVVLGAIDVVVIPAKNGPGIAPPGRTHHDEPFGRLRVAGSAVHVFPDLLRVAALSSTSPDVFFAEDLAVLHPVPPPHGYPMRPGILGRFFPVPPPAANECVNTSGYSAELVDLNFQHTDVGMCLRRRGKLVDYDLMSEKGASGSPIWKGPLLPSGTPACGIVLGGNTRLDTFSLVFTPAKQRFMFR
ncbi:MAG TPA: trypsin-like peptidase domain-containing protein [Kofleriaceae bacterium]